MLRRLFSSKTRVDLLALFFTHPDERYYVRQIARNLESDISGIKRELDNLEKAGLIQSEKVGNLRYYVPNKACPVYREIKSLIAKTVGAQAAIQEALRKIPGIEQAALYSLNLHAPGEGSGPIPLLVVGAVDLEALNEAITSLENKLAREISYTVFDPAEYRRRKAEGDSFLAQLAQGKTIRLIGGDDGL